MNAPQAWATEAGEGCFWVGGVLEGLRGVGGRGHCLQRGPWGETDAPREAELGSPGPLPLHGHQRAASHPPASCACNFSTDGTLPALTPTLTPTLHGQAGPASGTPVLLTLRELWATGVHPFPPCPGPQPRTRWRGGQGEGRARLPGHQGLQPHCPRERPCLSFPTCQDGEQSRGQVSRRVPGHQGRHDPVSSPGLWQMQGSLPTSKATKVHPGLAS